MQKKISTLVGIIIIVAVAVILFGGVFVYQYFSKPQTPSIKPQTPITETQNNQAIVKTVPDYDSYDCIPDSVNGNLSASFLIGKSLVKYCTSGTWGTFESNGRIVLNFGVPEASTPISPIVATWEIKNGELTIIFNNSVYGHVIMSGKDFKFFNFSGNIFAASSGLGCASMIIGPNKAENLQFIQNIPNDCYKKVKL